MNEHTQIRHWIEELPKRGRTVFTLGEVINLFSAMPKVNIRNALHRLTKATKICSVWRGVYAVILPEYGFSGTIPAVEYIDHLMNYLGLDYYIALRTAAALNGAAHQQPQIFNIVCNKKLRTKANSGIIIEPVQKKQIPHNYIITQTVNSGSVNVSCPELTAIDLLLYPQKAGGIDNIATILSELAEKMNFNRINDDFFVSVTNSAVQRLGFILDEVLNEHDLAEQLLHKAKACGIRFRKFPLVPLDISSKTLKNYTSRRWKIIVNHKIELDI